MPQVAGSNSSRKGSCFAARFWDQVHRKAIPTIEKKHSKWDFKSYSARAVKNKVHYLKTLQEREVVGSTLGLEKESPQSLVTTEVENQA